MKALHSMDTMNLHRIAQAETALFPYRYENNGSEIDTAITDLLTDLRHYADSHGVDFHKVLDMSYQHYLAEKIA